mgnify:FL=1|tara:strand:+ start:614 stop:901 length:288 start_codon:yes stop_codon:yes gene_type:complete
MKHKQPCVTPPNPLVAALKGKPMYCCAEWGELDPITQAQHRIADTQEWRDYKDHCEHIEFQMEADAYKAEREAQLKRDGNSGVDILTKHLKRLGK